MVTVFGIHLAYQPGQREALEYEGDKDNHERYKQDEVSFRERSSVGQGFRNRKRRRQRNHPAHARPAEQKRTTPAWFVVGGSNITADENREERGSHRRQNSAYNKHPADEQAVQDGVVKT